MTAEERLKQLEQENQALRQQLAQREELIEQLLERIAALEEREAKNSRNSSLPPSSDRFHRQPKSLRKPSGKKPGGQEEHPGSTLKFSEHPDSVLVHVVEQCEACHADLRAVAVSRLIRRQVVDVPEPRLIVQEHQAEQKQCPHCQMVSTAPFPSGVQAPVQYGNRIAALAVYLVHQQLLSWQRACEVLWDLLGIGMSEGTLAHLIQRCAKTLRPVEEQLKAALIKGDLLHQDETGLYVKGSCWWLHVASTSSLTHYAVHQKRGREALDAIGILPFFKGTSVHDGWRSYFLYEGCSHALCNVHLLRELVYITEQYKQEWATEMKKLLLHMKAEVEEAKARGQPHLDPLLRLALRGEYDRLIQQGWQANESGEQAPIKGIARRRKRHPAINLLDRLQIGKEAVLAFLSNFTVPFDNELTAYCTPFAWLACV